MSSACGSADVLEALGVNIVLSPGSVAQCLAETRIAFMFAQTFHPAMKHVAPVRREIGVRTIFNVLGPLTNPAGAPYQVIGVSNPFVMSRMAHALGQLGSRRALVVHGAGGVDELSLSGTNAVCEWTGTEVRNYSLRARELGLKQAPISAISGGSPEHNAKIVMAVLEAEPGAPRDTVLLNAAAGLYVSGRATSMTHGVRLAADSIDSGAALGTLRALVAESNRLGAIEKEGSVA
jgi:anthranilate phosphoribosyltransferase